MRFTLLSIDTCVKAEILQWIHFWDLSKKSFIILAYQVDPKLKINKLDWPGLRQRHRVPFDADRVVDVMEVGLLLGLLHGGRLLGGPLQRAFLEVDPVQHPQVELLNSHLQWRSKHPWVLKSKELAGPGSAGLQVKQLYSYSDGFTHFRSACYQQKIDLSNPWRTVAYNSGGVMWFLPYHPSPDVPPSFLLIQRLWNRPPPPTLNSKLVPCGEKSPSSWLLTLSSFS